MGSPHHIAGSASRLFPEDKASAEYKALSVIAETLAHPQRTLLSAFIQHAVDREFASRFFLDEISGQKKATVSEFLVDWASLLRKVRPVASKDLEESLRRQIWRRDGGQCCISKVQLGKDNNEYPLFVYVLSPLLFHDGDMAQNGRLYNILAAYIGELQLQNLGSLEDRNIASSRPDLSDQLMLLSPRMYEHFANGRLSFESRPLEPTKDSAQYFMKVNDFIPVNQVEHFRFITLENKAVGLASLPNAQLFEVHHRFADALAWLEVLEHMKPTHHSPHNLKTPTMARSSAEVPSKKSWIQWYIQTVTQIFQSLWIHTPVFFRAFAYKRLASIATRLYGYTGSERIHRLPFNLYLRVGSSHWASKHQAEFESLRLVEKHTQVPAPRGIDAIQYSDSSFLLMTGLSGKGIGLMLATMTDEQVDAVVQDLKGYIAELRHIPNKTGSGFQICNALGGGILDWRIGDSQRKELRFQDETAFNKCLTHDLPLNEDAWKQISRPHSARHDIVFTHADLNLRNILVDRNGKISGIVDWECAGWFPEYWEYSKMHFTVRHTARWIADVVDQVFPGYRDELYVEDMLSSMAPSW
ncbi:uncharacterized protein BDR25DRAFT_341390 [Lindgomyces ingoldianus]|uniref:Uncharacterized protein n=1 Tax=Lindgomyces ingoldianus TaxID=673940 RepID=A0ACB6R4N9_9PLEO|nr:uncharacterized protein BDR25DRAFT_341390 [Lindgomyces ingoldianus]KAF2473270.1 hypothetical protein BDR25DRAFT_341390 [Lindgomyces ingoldianus]